MKITGLKLLLLAFIGIVSVWVSGRSLSAGPVFAQTNVGCRDILANYGSMSTVYDRNGDGKVNLLDCLWSLIPSPTPTPTTTPPLLIPPLQISYMDGSNGTTRAVAGELVVKLKNRELISELTEFSEIASAELLLKGSMIDLNLVLIKLVNPSYESTISVYWKLNSLSSDPNSNIIYAAVNWISQHRKEPNDPIYISPGQWHLKAISAPKAWETVTGTHADLGIWAAVVDNGVDTAHPDLLANLNGNFLEDLGVQGVDDDHNGVIDDINGVTLNEGRNGWINSPHFETHGRSCHHGTQVTGTLAAAGDNGIGVSGTVWKGRVYNVNGSSPETCENKSFADTRAFELLNSMGPPVVNFSASHECPPEDDEATCLLRYRYVKEAIDKLTLTSSGAIKTLFVAAAPNESKNIDVNLDLPCRLNQTNPAIICVTRTGIVDNKEVFVDAGFGKNTVDLAAPGISIRTTDILNHYAVSSGTSLAAPQVTAAILMILQANPNLTLAQVKAILFNTVDTKNEVPSFGLAQNLDTPFHALEDKVRTKGRLNVDRAVRCAQDPELGCIYPLRKEQWNLEVIKAFDVHKQGIIGLDNHPEVFAGVIDSGVQADHPDLVANLHGNWAEYTGIGSDGNQIPNDVQGISLALNENGTLKNPYYKQQANGSAALPEYLKDDNGQPRCSGTSVPELAYQGTGVNGIIASAGQSYGLTGVNHRARILNINMFDVNSNGDCVASVPGLAQSLIYMAEVKAPVAQLSESVVCQDGIFPCEPSAVQLLKEAVCTFTHGDKYCEGKVERLLVVAMPDVNITSLAVFGPGILANRGYDYDFGDLSNLRTYPCHFARSERNPAGNEGIICVTSSRLNTTGPYSDNIERFEPDTAWWGRLTAALAAPGHRLLTTTLTGTGVPMSPTDNLLNYTYRTGTAYAAAHVTGAALLLMSASLDTTQPVGQQVTISPIQLKNLLLLTVDTKYHVPSFASAYWNFGNDQHWLLKALEDKVSTGGRLNLFRGWRCVQSHDCLSFASQMRSPIVFNSFAVQPVSSGKVKIFYMPPLTGEVHTDVNYYSNDVIYAVRDQLINNGLSTADVEIKWLEIPYNTPDEIMGNFTHGFSYFDTPGYINTGIVDSTGQIINQLQQSLEIGDKVVVIGSGLGADMLTDIFEQNPNLFMNPNMAALTLGAPFYESDSLANAEALSAATGSLWLNTNLNETFATQQLTGEHLQTIEQMAIRDQDFLDGFINNYDPADTQTEINQIVNHFSVN